MVIYLAFVMLMALNSLDFLTGLLASKIEHKKITSRKAKDGVLRKAAEWLAVAAALIAENIAFDIVGVELPAAAVVTVWISLCEIISVLENLGRCGVKVPARLLNQLSDKIREDDDNGKKNSHNTSKYV